jgi:hypothetical protein
MEVPKATEELLPYCVAASRGWGSKLQFSSRGRVSNLLRFGGWAAVSSRESTRLIASSNRTHCGPAFGRPPPCQTIVMLLLPIDATTCSVRHYDFLSDVKPVAVSFAG